MDRHERHPVGAPHAVAREVDPEARLGQLRRHLVGRGRDGPGAAVRLTVEAEILAGGVAGGEEGVLVCFFFSLLREGERERENVCACV